MDRRSIFLQQLQRAGVGICREDRRLGGIENSSDRTKDVVDRRRFITTVDHAVGALGICRIPSPVVFPAGRFHELGKSVGVAVL